tara:strand:- start:1530 stop:2600 length:1071 start_codon:yes stop_codon:yes gene_type:complete
MGDGSCLFFIITLFILLILLNVYFKAIIGLKKNWSDYKCHPLAIPTAELFGQDPQKNFTDCVATMQQSAMEDSMEPIFKNFEKMNELNSETNSQQKGILSSQASMKEVVMPSMVAGGKGPDGLPSTPAPGMESGGGGGGGGDGAGIGGGSGMIEDLGDIVTSLSLLTTKWGLTLGDAFAKMTGTVSAFAQAVAALPIIGESVLNSEAVGVIKNLSAISGFTTMDGNQRRRSQTFLKNPIRFLFNKTSCFHPDTILETTKGSVKISNIEVNDILLPNVKVIGVLKLENNQTLYNLNTVIVSGTHLVYYKNKFIFVSQHPDAIKTNIKTDFLYCLITSNHLIPIQNIIFHDWEDNHKV